MLSSFGFKNGFLSNFEGVWVRRLLFLPNGELKIFQNSSKTAFEAKGRQSTTGKVIQRLVNIVLYTYLRIYRYGWELLSQKVNPVHLL